MKYKKFIIENYKAITEPIEIDILKNPLMPIIGINECGKTTILQAIFSFDYNNDKMFDSIHLRDTQNLYDTQDKSANISALIEINEVELETAIKSILSREKGEVFDELIAEYLSKIPESLTELVITRNLHKKNYSIDAEWMDDQKLTNLIAKTIIDRLSKIIYFDDFRDSVAEKIEIRKDNELSPTGWLAIIETLFYKTDNNFSVFKLGGLEDRKRKSVMAKVKKELNLTLTKEWQNFKLDNKDALEIELTYEVEGSVNEENLKEYIKIEVIETDLKDEEHYFFIRDRSKGFFWFFNFVMKLEFNPKDTDYEKNTAIYLLDEPGSYLHATAQSKLAKKLKQLSKDNKVIYCTHSHYLLNPEIIPISTIKIAEKDGNGKVSLIPIFEMSDKKGDQLAFQPITDALQIKPFVLDISINKVLLVEGIHDYYAFEIFKTDPELKILPCTGANTIKTYISLMVFWKTKFYALWDNDEQGNEAYKKCVNFFDENIKTESFRLLPLGKEKEKILEDLFYENDMRVLKDSLGLPDNARFKTVITEFYYSANRKKLLKDISETTKNNFRKVFELLKN